MSEIILTLVITLIVAGTLFLAPAIAIRALARRRKPFYWTFNPANTFSIIVTDEDESGDGMRGGGNIVNALHAVTGKRLDKSAPDPMNWIFIDDEEDPDHEAFLYKTLGVQSMKSVFHTTRVNLDRRMRFAREDGMEELHTVTKVNKTRNVFYTGELTIVVKESDTRDRLGLDFQIDFSFARRYPVRSVLRLADSPAFLTSLVEKIVNDKTVILDAEAFIGSDNAKKNRSELTKAIEADDEFSTKVLGSIGFDITAVSVRDVTMSERHRRLLELKVEAEKEAEARIEKARGEKEAKVLINDADADRIERVVKPAAENDRTVAVRVAEAYERNQTVTTYAPGASTMLPLQK